MKRLSANLCSGGLDSYLAWKLVVPEAANVYVRIGHKYQQRELDALAALSAADAAFRWEVVDGPAIGRLETPSGIIPCRNALLLLTAAAHVGLRLAGPGQVALWLGALHGEINSDKSAEFCAAVAQVLDVSWRAQYWTEGVSFSVGSPVRDFTKAQLIRLYAEQGHALEALGATRSCYAEGHYSDPLLHCGRCPACFKRWMAFRVAGAAWDPTRYAADPSTGDEAVAARRKAQDGTYDAVRAAETLEALGR